MTNKTSQLGNHVIALMMLVRACLIGIFICLPATAEADFSGYLKTYLIHQSGTDNALVSLDSANRSQTSLRLMWDYMEGDVSYQLHYELSPIVSNRRLGFDDSTIAVSANAYRYSDVSSTLLSNPNSKIFENLDRLNFRKSFNHGDLTVGRQAISFGAARVINPTDVFLPFDVRVFNTEYRTGVDAIRYQHPFGALSEVDMGIVLGKDASRDESGVYVQFKGNSDGKDLSINVIQYGEERLLGVSLSTTLWQCGYWLELAHVAGEKNYYRVSTGLDYALSESVFGMLEYHFNGAGASDSRDYVTNTLRAAYQQGGVFLAARAYLVPSLSIQLNPLLNINLTGVANLTDHSRYLSVSAEYNALDNLYLGIGYQYFAGADAAYPQPPLPDPGSEYGINPDNFYLSLSYYF